jgi:hypothetical protein
MELIPTPLSLRGKKTIKKSISNSSKKYLRPEQGPLIKEWKPFERL